MTDQESESRDALRNRLLIDGSPLSLEAAKALAEFDSPAMWAMKKEAACWPPVVAALDAVKPDWVTQGSGGEMAAVAIRELAGRVAELESDLRFQKSVTDAVREQQVGLLERAEKAETGRGD